MKQVVLVKPVPNLAEAHVSKRRGVLIENGKRVLDPLSVQALEMGLRVREQVGGELIVMMLGRKEEEELLRFALAMGADRAVRLELPPYHVDRDTGNLGASAEATTGTTPETNPVVEWINGFMKVKLFTHAIQKMGGPGDLLLLGSRSAERGFGELPVRLAAALNLPCILDVSEVTCGPGEATVQVGLQGSGHVTSSVEKGSVELSLPVVLGVGANAPKPRIPNALAVMKAGKKPLEVWTVEALGIEGGQESVETWREAVVLSRTFAPEES